MLNEGMFIAERYEIIEKIGTGGMSYVYKAKDHTLGRFVAIKVLKSEFANDENFLQKFRSEAQNAAALSHPNIVNIYDVGATQEFNFIVMEYIEGITLKTYIEKKGQLSFKEAVSIAIQVGKGIEDAHKHHVIHRDIKPQNIMISTDGKVKVTDFGIARAASAETINSEVMGSVHYISPEQARNGFVDCKSDIYSLGIVMYEMVTGRVPFDADTAVAVAVSHIQDEMVHPSAYAPDLPVSMEGIILKCAQKSPDRRYQNMEELLTDLKKALISPNENFVVIPALEAQKTVVIGKDDAREIKNAVATTEDETLSESEGEEDEEEEEDDDDGFLNPKMEKIVTILGIVVVIVIFAILVFLAGNILGIWKFSSNSSDSDTSSETGIIVPDVTDMTYEEALETLNELGLGIKISSYETSDEYDAEKIMSQDPESGDVVDENTTIYVVVSSGEEASLLPSFSGETEEAAIEKIEALGLTAGTTNYEYSSSVEAGIVISQTPDANTEITEGMTVTLTVSRGAQLVSVPSVVNETEESARTKLTSYGLTVGTVTTAYSDTVSEGKVISQSISSGKQVESGTSVDLVISLGKKTEYVTVPKLTGNSLSYAQSALANLGLSCTYTEEYSDSVEVGYVISQSPSSGESVEQGSTVSIVISKGPDPSESDADEASDEE
ncbi:MAG: Stk1 family PASTA domain-containing Ser/Thr kinase [Eubacterium sp.]|nr:Stk1 family PASTA domain-containing Ser/Thr kinase [Eubacterium sp.]